MSKRIKYSVEHLAFLRTGYLSMNVRGLTKAFNVHFGTDKTEGQIRTAVSNRGITSGRTGRFETGHMPWNNGTKGQGLTGPNPGSFTKGHVPLNRKPLGSERFDRKNGYTKIKVAEHNPYTGFPTRYKAKHVHMWEQVHGPVPKGMVIAFRDGDEIEIDNLMMISRAELLRLNQCGYKDMPAELKPSIVALVKLETKTFSINKKLGGIS